MKPHPRLSPNGWCIVISKYVPSKFQQHNLSVSPSRFGACCVLIEIDFRLWHGLASWSAYAVLLNKWLLVLVRRSTFSYISTRRPVSEVEVIFQEPFKQEESFHEPLTFWTSSHVSTRGTFGLQSSFWRTLGLSSLKEPLETQSTFLLFRKLKDF